uniref:DNA-(apurinic or apyrimidinic site) lyase n=1 Tax=Timema shepardi TaxID=629360 RepID=A0A7R9ALN6_TIMSH|nr:unnamed protein product [Timema shepardi]
MVEGPGCKVKGENLNKRICNQKLIKIQSDDSKNTNKLGGDKTFQNSFESFVQSTVCEVRTLGKELFIFFKENALCIRVHFLMDGYIRINEAANVVGLKGSSKSAVLVIYLARDTVAIYNSHVDIRLYEDCLVRYNKLCQLDICSPEFDFPCANKLISSRPGKMVCDVIMDQDVLPGVGNIIKNEASCVVQALHSVPGTGQGWENCFELSSSNNLEMPLSLALFNSGINPNSTIGELTPDLVSRLVHRLRDFSAIFYKCRKQNKALSQYMKIYKKQRCGECGGRVTVCKPGELKRVTYFCASCQTNSVTNLPSTGSLLGFVANSLVLQYKRTPNLLWMLANMLVLGELVRANKLGWVVLDHLLEIINDQPNMLAELGGSAHAL